MCGITGIWQHDGASVDLAVLDRMTDALAHRGPDGRGTWLDGEIGFGHRRLAIRELSDLGRQPMADPSGRIVITYNGEIFNDAALAEELERDFGLVRRGHCDSEIIPLGFAAWGAKVFERLEGMFAIALWDGAEQHLYLARDAAGIKPLYTFETPGLVCFASEVKGLLAHPAVPRRIDGAALREYMALGYTAPGGCLLAGVEEVPPGTVRRYSADGRQDRRYWAPKRSAEITSLDEACEAVGATLKTVASDMLISDVPLGVLQSGGIDSTLVTMALQGSEVPLFTASFAGASHDESALAAQVASTSGQRHHLVPIEAEGDATATFRDMVRACDGQLADSSSYAVLLLSRAIRRHVTVALSGDGADEFFGGYPTYRATRLSGVVAPLMPDAALRALSRLCFAVNGAAEARYPVNETAGRLFSGMAQGSPGCHAAWRRLAAGPTMAALFGLSAQEAESSGLAGYRGCLAEHAEAGSAVDAALLADQDFYLPGDMLQKVDRMSMAAALEIRVPFLDRRMMDLAGQIDLRLLTPWLPPDKRVLRTLVRRWGGSAEVAGAAKRGFNVPLAGMLRGPLRPLGERYLDRQVGALEPHFAPDAVRRLWAEHLTGRRNHGYVVWSLLVFAIWYSDVVMENRDAE